MPKLFDLRVRKSNGEGNIGAMEVANNKVIYAWPGEDNLDAARNWADSHPGWEVFATRPAQQVGLFIGLLPIKQPGEK